MKIFLSISAALAWFFGAMLLFFPGPFSAPLGVTLTPMQATLGQAHGATLLGLGVINWLARTATGQGLKAVLAGNLVVQILSLAVATRVAMLGPAQPPLPAFAIHIILGGFYAYFVFRSRHS